MSNGKKQAVPVAADDQTEVQKLTQRLQWMGVSNFGLTPGDKATPEGVAKVISAALDHLESSEAKPVAAALPASNEKPWLIDQHLLYRLGELGYNIDEIAVTMVHGSRLMEARSLAAKRLLDRLAATPALPAEKVQGLTNGTIDGGDASLNQVFVTMDERPSTELWTVGNRCYLATTRPSAELTEPEILKVAAESGIYTKTQMGCTFDPCKLIPFANAILAASGGALAVPEGVALDAARYRWLRGSATDIGNVIDKEFAPGKWECRAGEELDSAIDAAISAAPAIPAQGQTK